LADRLTGLEARLTERFLYTFLIGEEDTEVDAAICFYILYNNI
jgi:hypothetical protein